MQTPQFGPYEYKSEYLDNGTIPFTACRHGIYERTLNPRVPQTDRKWLLIASFASWVEARDYLAKKRAESEEIKAQYELAYEIRRAQDYA